MRKKTWMEWPREWEHVAVLRRHPSTTFVRCVHEGRAVAALVSPGSLGPARRAHELLGSHAPRVLRHEVTSEGDRLWLDGAWVADGEQVARTCVERGVRLPLAAAIALNERAMDAFEAAHANGLVLGVGSWRNLVVDANGDVAVLGFGAPPFGRVGDLDVLAAPEVLLGAPASPASDVYLLHAALRRILPLIEHGDVFPHALAPESPVRDTLASLSDAALATDPNARPPTVDALRRRYRDVRRRFPNLPEPDPEALRRALLEIVGAPRRRLRLDLATRVAELDGLRLELARRVAPWRVLARLADERHAGSFASVGVEELIRAGWPDERIHPHAARDRLYTVVATLRTLGLGATLESFAGGYRLASDVLVER